MIAYPGQTDILKYPINLKNVNKAIVSADLGGFSGLTFGGNWDTSAIDDRLRCQNENKTAEWGHT